jgi:hypothetical protein
MILVPSVVTKKVVAAASAEAARKKALPALALLRLAPLTEGKAVQTLYIGSFAREGPVIAEMHRFIREGGHKLTGKHHEIYLSDPRRVAPEKLKTIIRQPFA